MRGYDGEEDGYYDEYEEEGEGEEYAEEEKRKPTAEEMEYLELRERIKEQIRKKMQKENGSALSKLQEKKKKLPSDNYGSFFGPSQPVIAQRVIQESKSLLENQHLALRVSNSQHVNRKSSSSTASGSKTGVHGLLPKLKTKVQKLKDTRDYSFLLSDDSELLVLTKESAPRNVSARNSDIYSAQVPEKCKQLSSSSSRNTHGSQEEKNSVSRKGQMPPKIGSSRPISGNKPNTTTMDSKRQFTGIMGTGPGRPAGSKGMPLKTPVLVTEKKALAPSAKKSIPATCKPPPKIQSCVPRQNLEHRKDLQEVIKAKMIPKQSLTSSKPQINKSMKQVSSHASVQDIPKKKPARPFPNEFSDEEDDPFSMLRKMIGRKGYARHYDDDDSDMEANFDDIMQEERRSAMIARKEDEEQLRLIEEEERQEQMRKLTKKRKLSHR